MGKGTESKWELTIEGEYYKRVGTKEKDIEFYSIKVVVPGRVANSIGCMSYLKNNVLDQELRRIDPKSAGPRTYSIVDRKLVSGKDEESAKGKPIAKMNKKELSQFIIDNELPIKVDDFGNIAEVRQAVSDMMDDKKLQEQQTKEKEAQKEKEKELPLGADDIRDMD